MRWWLLELVENAFANAQLVLRRESAACRPSVIFSSRVLRRDAQPSRGTPNRTRIDRLNHHGYRPGLPLRPELGADALALCRVG